MMKKLLVCLLSLVLLLTTAALAEVQVETVPLDNMPFMSRATNCYYTRVDGGYQLFDAQGNAISAVYGNLTAKANGLYYEYYGEGLNNTGLLDANGKVIAEVKYGQFYTYDDGWALAFVLTPVNGDTGDFRDSNNNWYNAAQTDVYCNGKFIGTLTRDEYQPAFSVMSLGKYFGVKQTSGSGYYIDQNFNKVYVTSDYFSLSSEYEDDYRTNTVTHVPTQQKAFCATCTLTPDDVNVPVWYDDSTGELLDLQGNVIKSGLVYDYTSSIAKDVLRTKRNGSYGIVDYEGNVLLEPIYADIAVYYGVYPLGYQAVITAEGHLNYLDKQGNVTAKAEYGLSSYDYKGYDNNAIFACVKNLGKYMVITAAKGELPTTYEDANTPGTRHQILTVKKDGLWGAIDINGDTVIPFIHRSALEISSDSTLVSGVINDTREYVLYRLSYGETQQTETATSTKDGSGAATLKAGEWQCSCGAVNTGKFCGFCGSKQPEATPTPAPTAAPADGSWTCSCGSVNTGKFCPECGSAKPADAEPQCANCGYKPEGETPKFCPECGTKF